MKAYIEQRLSGVANPIAGRNLLREYLQSRILTDRKFKPTTTGKR
jgi:hypothetical protein